MNYYINNEILAKLRVMAKQQNISVDILLNKILNEYLKDVNLNTDCKLSKPASIKKVF